MPNFEKNAPGSAPESPHAEKDGRFDSAYALPYQQQYYAPGSIDEIYFQLTRAVVLAGRKWRKVANGELRTIGQSQARWEALFVIAFAGGEISQRQLAKLLSIEAPTLVRMIDTLETEGLIERVPDANDKRQINNHLTVAGHAVVDEIKQLTDGLRLTLFRDISLQDIEITQRVMSQMIERLDNFETQGSKNVAKNTK